MMSNALHIRLLLFLVTICTWSSSNLLAQHTVKGLVTDQTGEPLIGVNITLKDTPTGTATDVAGQYELTVPNPSDTLQFTYIGYLPQSIPIEGRSTIDITLLEDKKALQEVVVTALGVKRQKRELGYSTESFTGDAFEKSNDANIIGALSGRSAGVQITTPNGVDGGTSRITIRGNNNIDIDNQPLIVVDGVPIENPPGLEDIGRGVDWGSAINNINPADIESMNILKGPTAAGLYGSRGANGVILIKTKRGEKRKGIGIDYNVNYKIIQPFYYRDVQNIFGAGGPTSLLPPSFEQDEDGTLLYPRNVHTADGPLGLSTTELFGFYSTGMSWGPKMEGQQIRWWDGEMRSFDPQPDNLKAYFSNGGTMTHNVSFSGGGDFGSMRVSLTRTDHNAIIPNSTFHQNTANIGATLNISPKVNADISLSYINYNRLNSPTLGDDNNTSFGKGILYSWPRSYKGLEQTLNFNADGSRYEYGDIEGGYPFTFTPPYLWWNTEHNNTTLDRNKLIGAITLNYQMTNWLSAQARLGLDFNLDEFETRNRPTDVLGIQNGFYAHDLSRDLVQNNDLLITAQKDSLFGSKFKASLSVGGTRWERNLYGVKGQNNGEWVNPFLYTFTNFGDPLQSPNISEVRFTKKINSIYSFLNLGYSNYLFLELSGRNDWSSSLPIDANSFFYPSASLSFIPTEAFKGLQSRWLNFWKVRAAYASAAVDANPYQLNFVYETSNFGGQQTASLPSTIPPLALKHQSANSYEIGTTLGLLNDRIGIDFTYYYIKSFNQILDAPLPASAGATQIKINSAELENKGIELLLNATIIENKDFFWQTGFNLSRNRNFVKKLGGGATIKEIANIWGENGPAIAVQEEQEFGTIVGYDYIYHEETGKPIVNDAGTHYLKTEKRVPIGNASPDFVGGWNMRLGYKGFELASLIDTKWGGDIYAGSYAIGLQTGQSPETLPERMGEGLPYTDPAGNTTNSGVILDGVYSDGTPNDKIVHYYFKYIGNTGGWGRYLSTPAILENSWIKMRELSLSYQVPVSFLERSKFVQRLSFSIVGRNLFYLYSSLPDRINPEGGNGAGNAQGLEWAAYPGTRSVTFGIKASF